MVPTSLIVPTLSIGVADGEGDKEVVVVGGRVLVWTGVVVVVVIAVPAQAVSSIEIRMASARTRRIDFFTEYLRNKKLVV
jgi:prepilin signal peptidase PulO-like enzyme (type II secretory pathway)